MREGGLGRVTRCEREGVCYGGEYLCPRPTVALVARCSSTRRTSSSSLSESSVAQSGSTMP